MKPRRREKKLDLTKKQKSSGKTFTKAQLQSLADHRLKFWLTQLIDSPVRSRIVPLITPGTALDCGVEVISASQIKVLNYKYRKKRSTTDILSFGAPPIFLRTGFLGHLFICHPVWIKQAKTYKNSVREELDVLLVHGLLHLIGFDHELGKSEADEMAFAESLFVKKRKSLIRRAVLGRAKI
jgi:rRNA maturation RNase YbeY